MKWYYESNGQPHGPVDESELRQLIEDGKLLGDSLVWRQGMLDWTPLKDVNDFATRLKPAEPALPQHGNPSGSKTFDAPVPVASLDGSAPKTAPLQGQVSPEWEHLQEVGPLRAFFVSLREIALDPEGTFQNLARNRGWGVPLLFLAVAEVVGNILMALTLKQMPASASPTINLLKQALPADSGGMLVSSSAASLLMLPLAIALKAVLLHASFRFIGQSVHPFSTTFRTLCYSLGTGSMLWGIPLAAVSITTLAAESTASVAAFFLAALLIGFWSLWINLKALASAHEISLSRAIASLFVPPLIAFLATFLIFGGLAVVARN